MSQSLRLFIASGVSGAVRDTLNEVYQRREFIATQLPQRVRWVEPVHWHLTWLFLGNVPLDQLSSIQARLTTALEAVEPALQPTVSIELRDIVFWPSGKKPKMIVGRLSHSPKLTLLAETIRQALPDYPADKPFNPHVTLARLKENQSDPTSKQKPSWMFKAFSPVTCVLESVTLYSSTLTPAGPIYQPVHIIPLANLAALAEGSGSSHSGS